MELVVGANNMHRQPDLYRGTNLADLPAPTAEDVVDALGQVRDAFRDLETLEDNLARLARQLGVTWPEFAAALDLASPQAAQQRYARRGVRFRDQGPRDR
jgi:hypothetical protein